MRQRNNRAIALDLARAGLPVFPATTDKIPLVKSWQRLDKELTTDDKRTIKRKAAEAGERDPLYIGATKQPHVVDHLWDKEPGAAPGLSCGPAGIVVVDCDRKNVPDGPEQTLVLLADNQVDLSRVPMVTTGSGGRHLYFSNPGKIGCGKIKRLDIDIKGVGGFVMAPGVQRSADKAYTPDPDSPTLLDAMHDLPPLPQCLIDLMSVSRSQADADETIQSAITDLRLGEPDDLAAIYETFDFDTLRLKDEELAAALDTPSPDHSENRFTIAKCLRREYPSLTVHHYAKFLDTYDGAGSFTDAAQHGPGEYNDRDIAREFVNAEGSTPITTGEAFGQVSDDSYGTDVEPEHVKEARRKRSVLVEFGSEFLDAPDNPPVFIIDDLIEAATLFVLYGHPGAGKSALMLDMLSHVSSGLPWANRPVKQGYVLYVTVEGPAGTQRRIKAWAKKQAAAGRPVDLTRLAIIRQPVDMFGSDTSMLAIQKAVSQFPGPCLMIVFDTLRQVLVGGDENASSDVSVFTTRLAKLRDATGAACGFVHHTGKDKAKGAAGSTAIVGNVDVELFAEKKSVTDRFASLRAGKLRDGFMPEPIIYDLVSEEVAQKADGRPVTAVVAVVRGSEGAVDGSAFGAVLESEDTGADEPPEPVTIVEAVRSDEGGKDSLLAEAAGREADREALIDLIVLGDVPRLLHGPHKGGFKMEDLAAADESLGRMFNGAKNFSRNFRRRYLNDQPSLRTKRGTLELLTVKGLGSIIKFRRSPGPKTV